MKVVAFNGSPKKEGNTYHAIQLAAKQLEAQGISVDIIHVGNKVIRGCMACGQCAKNKNEQCIYKDEVNDWIQEMKAADGIIIASPTHYAGIGGTMKSFLDRAFYVTGMNGGMLRHKVGASIVAVRRSGGIPTFTQLNNFLSYAEMMMPTSNYWHVIHGTQPGEALEDTEGVQIMEILGNNMAMMLKQREATEAIRNENPPIKKKYMNFIR